MLALLQAERRDLAERSHQPTVETREKRLSAIFNHRYAVFFRKLHNPVHITRVSEKMCDDDGSGMLAQTRFNRLSRDVVCCRIDISEDWNSALIEDRGDRPHVGDGGSDNFISWFRVDRGDCRVNSGSPRSTRIRVFDA